MLQLYEASYAEAVQTYAAQQQGRRRRDEYRGCVQYVSLSNHHHHKNFKETTIWQI